jgi:hypothetical protein
VVLETVFAEEGLEGPETVASPLVQRALSGETGIAGAKLDIDRPLIGLGASAPVYYPAVGDMLGTDCIVPVDTDVANALGAVVGQVRVSVEAHISQPAEGIFRVMAGEVVRDFQIEEESIAFAETTLEHQVAQLALEAGTDEAQISITCDLSAATVEDQRKFIEAVVIATASGRPRIAH